MSDCLFCKIVAGEVPCTKVYEDNLVFGFKDLYPAAPHHVLFVPKKHIATINDLSGDDVEAMGGLFLAAKIYAKEIGVDEDGYRVVMNCNEAAGQTVFHVHLHFLAGRALAWPPG